MADAGETQATVSADDELVASLQDRVIDPIITEAMQQFRVVYMPWK
jgi:hypothetical protein